MNDRPTTDPRLVVLDAIDGAWGQLGGRLVGLSSAEMLWEPGPDCWSVRDGGEGAEVDGAFDREIDPAPVTTIGWRLWHLAVDCLDSYSERLFGATGAAVAGSSWHLETTAAMTDLDRAWSTFRDGLEGRSAEQWWEPLGEGWGPFAQHSLYDLVLHAHHEITHHGAEIALLRDLYRIGPGGVRAE